MWGETFLLIRIVDCQEIMGTSEDVHLNEKPNQMSVKNEIYIEYPA